MAYSTVANIKTVLLNVSNYAFSDATIELFITKADAFIDGYLASVYTVPFTTTPALINSISVDMTCYYLLRTAFTNDRIEMKNSWVLEYYNNSIDILKKLLNEEMSLGSSYSQTNIQHNNDDYSPTFNLDDDLNWETDKTRLEAIADDRD